MKNKIRELSKGSINDGLPTVPRDEVPAPPAPREPGITLRRECTACGTVYAMKDGWLSHCPKCGSTVAIGTLKVLTC